MARHVPMNMLEINHLAVDGRVPRIFLSVTLPVLLMRNFQRSERSFFLTMNNYMITWRKV